VGCADRFPVLDPRIDSFAGMAGQLYRGGMADGRHDDVRRCKLAGNDCATARPIAEAVN